MVQHRQGQAIVEFALILPLLLAVMLALIDGALLIQGYITVNHAAREATRFAVAYRPNQGECLDNDGDGIGTDEPWPYCPQPGYTTDPYENDQDYYARRVKLIKLRAVEATLGLRTEDVCNGDPIASNTCIENHLEDSGMLGIRVWGLPDFESAAQEDHPGIPGLTVRTMVVHNVPLTVFAPILPRSYVRVSASAEMINEGVQVGYGNLPPPTIGPATLNPNVTPLPTSTSGPTPTSGPTFTPTPLPVYNIDLDFTTETNMLPDDREHRFGAQVTNPQGDNIAGAQVTFRTNAGSFSSSGTGLQTINVTTGGDGWARTTIYANEPTTATIDAWLDYDGDLTIDGDEPSDQATKFWDVSDEPYLIISDHNPSPTDWLGVDLMNHPPNDNPYSLWWCPQTVTATNVVAELANGVNVEDDTWNTASSVSAQVPLGVAGTYRIESHTGYSGSDGCSDSGSLAAYSAAIEIAQVPPDLHITNVEIVNPVDERLTGYPITITVEIENLAVTGISNTPFDVDLYLNLEEAPTVGRLGDGKQWLTDIDPLGTRVMTFTTKAAIFGDNNLWIQVDTSNYIDEGPSGGETNNVFGPLDFSMECGIPDPNMSDDFAGNLGGQWSTYSVGNANGSQDVNGSNQLEVTSRGSSIWSGDNDFYYIYQPYDGDFDARLRIIEEPTTSNWAKIGLMAREDPEDDESPYTMNMATHDGYPAAEQAAYRDTHDGTASRTSGSSNYRFDSLPSWVRIIRQNGVYDYYYSSADDPAGDDWTHQGTHTPPRALNYVGIAHASYSSQYGTGIVDDFEICTEESVGFREDIRPPGLKECTELVSIPSFEGNPETVFEYWRAGGPGAYNRTSQEFYRGSFSMRLHASLGSYPCMEDIPRPYLYQEVQIPTDVYSISTFTVEGKYFVDQSYLECSVGGPDSGDELDLHLRTLGDSDIITAHVTSGAAVSQTWNSLVTDLGSGINLADFANETLKLYWNATQNDDYHGTFFYLDDVSAQVCTEWPIPEDEPGTGSIGGMLQTLGEFQAPVKLTDANVWAYAPGGAVHQTRSIQDGTYHFYNIDPGTYVIYAETWVNGDLRTATTEVAILDGERNYDINLLLQ